MLSPHQHLGLPSVIYIIISRLKFFMHLLFVFQYLSLQLAYLP